MGSYNSEPSINPSPEPWYFPAPPDYFSASTKEYCSPFESSFSPENTWYRDPPINTSKLTYFPKPDYFSMSPEEFSSRYVSSFSPEGTWSCPDPPIKMSKATWYFTTLSSYRSRFSSSFSLSNPEPGLIYRTSGEGLHELHDNTSSGAPKADDGSSALANVEGSWVNISDTLYGQTVSDGCGDSDGKWTTVESMGTTAGAHNWNSKEKSSESKGAWNTFEEKETGEGGGSGEYHACEELSGRGSCGNLCNTCGEADPFARKCSLCSD